MNNNNFSEHVTIVDSSIMVFAMQHATGDLVWSIGLNSHSVGFQLMDTSKSSIESLKELRKAINGAIKFLDEASKKSNDSMDNINDENKN